MRNHLLASIACIYYILTSGLIAFYRQLDHLQWIQQRALCTPDHPIIYEALQHYARLVAIHMTAIRTTKNIDIPNI